MFIENIKRKKEKIEEKKIEVSNLPRGQTIWGKWLLIMSKFLLCVM